MHSLAAQLHLAGIRAYDASLSVKKAALHPDSVHDVLNCDRPAAGVHAHLIDEVVPLHEAGQVVESSGLRRAFRLIRVPPPSLTVSMAGSWVSRDTTMSVTAATASSTRPQMAV